MKHLTFRADEVIVCVCRGGREGGREGGRKSIDV